MVVRGGNMGYFLGQNDGITHYHHNILHIYFTGGNMW